VDAAKLRVLQSIGYEIKRTCGSCLHARYPSEESDWGTCSVNQYEHEKHTGPARDLSIHRTGKCAVEGPEGYQPNPVAMGMLGGFAQLLEEPLDV